MLSKNNISELKQKHGISGDIYASVNLYESNANRDSFYHNYMEGIDGEQALYKNSLTKHSWIRHGSKDNLPNILRNVYRKSTIHKSAVNIKTNLIRGGGLEFTAMDEYYHTNEDGDVTIESTNLTEAEKEQLVKDAKAFCKKTLMDRYVSKASSGLSLYGAYFGFGFYKPNATDSNAKLQKLVTYPAIVGRLSSERDFLNDKSYESVRHYFSDDFSKYTPSPINPLSYKEWLRTNPTKRRGRMFFMPAEDDRAYMGTIGSVEKGNHTTLSKYVRNETEFRDFYGTPDYESEDFLAYVDVDYGIAVRDRKDIESGFTLDYIIIRYRTRKPTEAEELAQQKKDKDFFKQYKGPFGEKSILMWAEPEINDSGETEYPEMFKIIEIPHDTNPQRLGSLREERMMKMLNGHNIITGEIIGMPRLSTSGFSSQAEFLIAAQTQLYQYTIKPLQEKILEDLRDRLHNEGLFVEPSIKRNPANFRVLTEKLMMWMLGLDEARHLYDFKAMTDEVRKEVLERVVKIDKPKEAA